MYVIKRNGKQEKVHFDKVTTKLTQTHQHSQQNNKQLSIFICSCVHFLISKHDQHNNSITIYICTDKCAQYNKQTNSQQTNKYFRFVFPRSRLHVHVHPSMN
jgi:hypothetical protein